MPETQVIFYRGDDGRVPALDFFRDLLRVNSKAFARCLAKIRLLRTFGNELRRPHVDYLRDGIYELRAKEKTVQYRMLFFYHGRNVAIFAGALTKERDVPAIEIERAIERRMRYAKNPSKHSAVETLP